MESPKFIICPECNERYNDTNKRRLIDTCGHPRCYSCLFKDNPCPVCSKLPRRRERERARTLSNEKLLEGINGEAIGKTAHHPTLSDTATFSGMFRKDSYLRTLYGYDPGSKAYNMEERIRRYRSLEILNDRTCQGSITSDFFSDVFVSSQDTADLQSLSSSIDELDEGSPKSSTTPEPQDKTEQNKPCPKAWPSCPDLSSQENVWQMRPIIERRKRPSSLYQMKYSTSSPRSSLYSARSSGYWSELEQLSESASLVCPTPKYAATEVVSAVSQDAAVVNTSRESEKTTSVTTPTNSSETISQKEAPRTMSALGKVKDNGTVGNQGNKTIDAWQMTRGVLQRRPKNNRTRSTECLRVVIDGDTFQPKTILRVHSMSTECHTKKFSENNVQRKAYMTDV